MEFKQDIGEEIISKLKELTKVIEKIMREVRDGKKRTHTHKSKK